MGFLAGSLGGSCGNTPAISGDPAKKLGEIKPYTQATCHTSKHTNARKQQCEDISPVVSLRQVAQTYF